MAYILGEAETSHHRVLTRKTTELLPTRLPLLTLAFGNHVDHGTLERGAVCLFNVLEDRLGNAIDLDNGIAAVAPRSVQ